MFSNGADWALCAIALGSNLGDSRQILTDALAKLDTREGISLEKVSSFYQTAPVGPPQPDFYNACAILRTTLSPEALLRQMLSIEVEFGRVRRERWGPRLLDLDLLMYGDLVLTMPNLQIPHPRMHERAFVLVPFGEVAPNWIDPISGKRIAELADAIDASGVRPDSTNATKGR